MLNLYKLSVLEMLFSFKGCYAALKDEITTYGKIFIGVGITVMLIEVIAVTTFYYIAPHFNINSIF